MPSLLALAVIAIVAVANEIQEQVQELPIAHVTMGDISRLMFYILPMLAAFVVPITYMMGILLAFGRMSQDGEIIAMKAAGIPLKRIILPVIVTGGVLSVACLWVQDQVQPWAIGKMYQLVGNEIQQRITLDTLQPGVMHEFRDWRVYMGGKDPETGALLDLSILQPGRGGVVVYHADSAHLATENGRTRLEMQGVHHIPASKGGNVTAVVAPSIRIALPAFEARKFPKTRHAMTIRGLYRQEKESEKTYKTAPTELLKDELQKLRQEIADRLSLPFACLAVSFMAAPLGARAKRSGRSYTFAVGLAIILGYYILKLLMEPSSFHSLSTIVLRAWAPNLVLCLAGLYLVWRVDRA